MKPTITPELREATAELLALRVAEDKIRPIVVAYQREVLLRHQWTIRPDFAGRRGLGEIILDPELSYLLSDEDAEVYFAETEAARDAHGWGHLPHNYCPLLMAVNRRIKAEYATLIAAEYITEIDTDDTIYDIALRREIVDNVIGLVVSLTEITGAEVAALFAAKHSDLVPDKDLQDRWQQIPDDIKPVVLDCLTESEQARLQAAIE